MIPMIARRRMTYNHRMLQAGDEFDVLSDTHAEILVLRRKARRRVAVADVPAAPVSLRDEALSLGIAVDGRWGDRRLKAEIDLARSYL